HAQRAEAHVLGIVVIGEGEGVPGIQPPVIEVPALSGFANVDHAASCTSEQTRIPPIKSRLMKKGLLALALLMACIPRERDHPSSFLSKGVGAAIDSAATDALEADPQAHRFGHGLSGSEGGTYVRPAHFEYRYQISFDHADPRLLADCVAILGRTLPQY